MPVVPRGRRASAVSGGGRDGRDSTHPSARIHSDLYAWGDAAHKFARSCRFAWSCNFRTLVDVSPLPRRPACSGGLRASKKERTRAALCDAAVRLCVEHGFSATTVEAIAHEADVSVRTFHNYFAGKAALFAELAVGVIADYADHLVRRGVEAPDETFVEAVHRSWVAMLHDNTEELDSLRALLEALENEQEIKNRLFVIAPEATAPIRAEIARRIGVDPDSSITAWFGTELCFMGAVHVLRAGELGLEHSDDPERLLGEVFSGLTALATH